MPRSHSIRPGGHSVLLLLFLLLSAVTLRVVVQYWDRSGLGLMLLCSLFTSWLFMGWSRRVRSFVFDVYVIAASAWLLYASRSHRIDAMALFFVHAFAWVIYVVLITLFPRPMRS